jgi:Rrf2 family transcriptional regulator, cysteine metabolism repressor
MRLSRKSEYACLAMIDLAEYYRTKPITMTDLAKRKSIPKKYLEQILLTLKRAGYVKSARGPGGGYSLAKPPQQISLAEIIRLLDGPIAPVESVSKYFYEHSPVEASKDLTRVFKDIRDYAARKLEHTRLSDFL